MTRKSESDLIAESHQAEVVVLAMSQGKDPALGVSVVKTIQRLANALEAATRVPVQGEGYTVEIDGQHFTQAQWEAVQRYCGGSQAVQGGPNDDREAIAKALCEGADTCWDDLTEQERVWHYRDAESVLAAGFSRATVPDAATEVTRQAEAELRDMLRVDIPSLKAERDAALARVAELEATVDAQDRQIEARSGETAAERMFKEELLKAKARIAEVAKLHQTHTDELDGAQFCKECGWVAGFCNTARALGLNEGENEMTEELTALRGRAEAAQTNPESIEWQQFWDRLTEDDVLALLDRLEQAEAAIERVRAVADDWASDEDAKGLHFDLRAALDGKEKNDE